MHKKCATASTLDYTSVEEKQFDEIKVYPNPCSDNLSISGIEKETDYKLVDQMGRMVKFGQLNMGLNQLDLSQFEKGLYFLSINGEVEKIVIE